MDNENAVNLTDFIEKVITHEYKEDLSLQHFEKSLLDKSIITLIENKQTELCKEWNTEDEYKFFYRGQSDINKDLRPYAFRDGFYGKENVFYEEALCKFPQLDGLSYFDQIATMAHYGAPTRLLDITDNPLVALHFACGDIQERGGGVSENNTDINPPKDNKSSNEEDLSAGAVYVFKIPKSLISSIYSDRVMLLSSLVAHNEEQLKDITEAIKYFIKQKVKHSRILSDDKRIIRRNNYAIARLVHEVQKKCPAFKNCIEPIDMICPRVVIPPRRELRMVAQGSAFFLPGLELYPDETMSFISDSIQQFKVAEILIPNGFKKDIKKELAYLQITEENLFPEMDKAFPAMRKRIEKP